MYFSFSENKILPLIECQYTLQRIDLQGPNKVSFMIVWDSKDKNLQLFKYILQAYF